MATLYCHGPSYILNFANKRRDSSALTAAIAAGT